MRGLIALLFLLLAGPASAQQPREPEPEWRQAREEHVLVRIGAFEPDPLRLEAGRPTRLVFYNNSRARLSLRAEDFFRAARIRSRDEALIRRGGMVLAPGERREVVLVPRAGRYRMRSQSWFRRFLGMSAEIIVEPAERAERR
jgi:hypothetical protein